VLTHIVWVARRVVDVPQSVQQGRQAPPGDGFGIDQMREGGALDALHGQGHRVPRALHTLEGGEVAGDVVGEVLVEEGLACCADIYSSSVLDREGRETGKKEAQESEKERSGQNRAM
jgi:hypothetical protein